jgi:undecaprenyl diphosphate synthase
MSNNTQTVQHLGLILDGNRRWAKAQGLPTLEGHRQGAEVFKTISLAAFERGIKYVSAYVFSTENWARTQEEVSYLMKLVVKAVEKYLVEFHRRGIKVIVLGSRAKLDNKVLDAINRTVERTKDNTNGTLALCFNYGGHQEIADAVNKAIEAKKFPITPDIIEQNLYSSDVPNADLLIRTSGEQRISGFMLWRAAYAELAFTDTLWPDFSVEELDRILMDYTQRERRFGK